MNITLNGTKHTIPDDSTHVAVDDSGEVCVTSHKPTAPKDGIWDADCDSNFTVINTIYHPKDHTKCLAEVSDGAVISFEEK